MESIKTSDRSCAKLRPIVDAKDQRHGRRHLEIFLAEQDAMMKKLLRISREQDETNRNILSRHQEWRQIDEERKCHQIIRTSECKRHKSRNPDRDKETCEWFLGHPSLRQRLKSEGQSLLWVSADPGYGKSVYSPSRSRATVSCTAFRPSCYFFKDDNPDQKNVANALCALLHQLFSAKAMLLRHALPEFKQNGSSICKNFDLLWRILVRAAVDPEAGEVICILDALDECEWPRRHELTERLRGFFDNPRKREPKKQDSSFWSPARREEETESISQEIEKVIKPKIQEIGK